jgi:dihydroorotase
MASYDLILKGGHVVDPAQGINGTMDIAFAGGKVAAVAASISDSEAPETRDVSGRYVVPGLIDLHTHVYWGGTFLGVDPNVVARRSGMTTAVDAGSCGANNIGGLLRHVAPLSAPRILAFLNLSVVGIFADSGRLTIGEAEDLRLLDIKHCVDAAKANADGVVGVKVRVGASSTAQLGAMPLHMGIRAAELAGNLPVMAHIGAGMPPRIEDIVEPLRRGDVLTHFCTPKSNSPLTVAGEIRDCMIAARERGVIMDVGHGSGSFGFKVAEKMLADGFVPDVISSDVHAMCIDGPAFDVLETMSKLLVMGMPLQDVIRAATQAPAAVCRRAELGTLSVGSAGDATILDIRKGPVEFTDSIGGKLKADRRFVAQGVVLRGAWWADGPQMAA